MNARVVVPSSPPLFFTSSRFWQTAITAGGVLKSPGLTILTLRIKSGSVTTAKRHVWAFPPVGAQIAARTIRFLSSSSGMGSSLKARMLRRPCIASHTSNSERRPADPYLPTWLGENATDNLDRLLSLSLSLSRKRHQCTRSAGTDLVAACLLPGTYPRIVA
jgi:hypothetical protein